MKKSLIALAIASAVSAPAFAATSNVDVYGVLNLSVNYVDQDVPGTDASSSITSTASRLGVKGAEDLGGGLAAIWQIEAGFNADEFTSLAARNTFVGLKGGWGTALLGTHDTPMKMMGRMVDNFGDTLADSRNILGAVDTGANIFDLRTKNTVAYMSPNWSGFSLAAAYSTDVNASSATITGANAGSSTLDAKTTDAYSINAVYNNGPLMLGAAYEAHNGLGSGIAPNSGTNAEMWRVVAGFDIAGFKLAGLYEQIDGDVAAYNRDAYGLFASYGMGAWNFKGNYLAANESDRAGGNDGANQWTVGADYSLSKRTVVYGLYAATNNDLHAAYGLGTGAGSSDATSHLDSNPSTVSLGVKHSF